MYGVVYVDWCFVEAVGADPSPFTFLGIAVPVFSYADSVFPVILGVGLLAIVYHLIDRFIPDVLKMVLVPMLSLVISVPLTLLVFAPLGAYGGLALADGIVWLFSLLGPVAGVPIDISGRMGLGNLIPGTGLLTKKTDHTSDVAELAGPAGDLAKRAFQAGSKAMDGAQAERR